MTSIVRFTSWSEIHTTTLLKCNFLKFLSFTKFIVTYSTDKDVTWKVFPLRVTVQGKFVCIPFLCKNYKRFLTRLDSSTTQNCLRRFYFMFNWVKVWSYFPSTPRKWWTWVFKLYWPSFGRKDSEKRRPDF